MQTRNVWTWIWILFLRLLLRLLLYYFGDVPALSLWEKDEYYITWPSFLFCVLRLIVCMMFIAKSVCWHHLYEPKVSFGSKYVGPWVINVGFDKHSLNDLYSAYFPHTHKIQLPFKRKIIPVNPTANYQTLPPGSYWFHRIHWNHLSFLMHCCYKLCSSWILLLPPFWTFVFIALDNALDPVFIISWRTSTIGWVKLCMIFCMWYFFGAVCSSSSIVLFTHLREEFLFVSELFKVFKFIFKFMVEG